ncbi:Aste57867_18543 [Aphanomyces stellatus]|uniref:Aste57867_18543 protein n=1 Tax=Aphanomyces stellatus TaxID=120398 RepID=A0A485LC07_9STRA|nr:hypothetical protein As57867_018481 [Aphanomyces stellatus]VFT95279.1 Aste57867_18543 [Aphanomyces stellatus]
MPASTTLVKAKRSMSSSVGGGREYLYKVAQSHPAVTKLYTQVTSWLGFSISACVLLLVAIDSCVNNWALNDFVGNGQQFKTPIAKANTILDLVPAYAFAAGYNLSTLSNVGFWMTDSTIQNLVSTTSSVFVLSAGTYQVSGAAMNLCGAFAGSYPVNLTQAVKLGVATDAMTFLRGSALSHAFSDDLTTNLPNSSSRIADAVAKGFVATRVQVDMKLTTTIPVVNTTTPQNFNVTWYRIYSKAYCTGCAPIAELGLGQCNMTMAYNDSTHTLKVTQSTYILGSDHLFGLMINRDIYGTLALVLKYIAIFIAAAGYLAGRKTVQWREVSADKVETLWEKAVDAIAPKYFPHLSHAIRLDLFCYNSDLFVTFFVASTVLDMNHALMYIREVNVFNENSPHFEVTLQLFALSSRLLWLNIGFVKVAKILLHLVYPATYCGESRLMPWLNFSSVSTMYLSGILLYYIPRYIEYNNQCRWDNKNHDQLIDGFYVNFFDSFYFRVALAVGIGLVLNVVVFLALDHWLLFGLWHKLKKNSLSRQAIYNSTSVISEYLADVDVEDNNCVMHVKARRLSTLQWFFLSHMLCFALPEKEMQKKKGSGMATVTVVSKGDVESVRDSMMCMVGQAESGHLHLLDERLADVKSLAFNIKILRDVIVTIQ